MLFMTNIEMFCVTFVNTALDHCSTHGALHFTTFDGRDFDYRGRCTYTLTQDCGNHANAISVRIANNQWNDDTNNVQIDEVHVNIGNIVSSDA